MHLYHDNSLSLPKALQENSVQTILIRMFSDALRRKVYKLCPIKNIICRLAMNRQLGLINHLIQFDNNFFENVEVLCKDSFKETLNGLKNNLLQKLF